jgi:hypothetical protein
VSDEIGILFRDRMVLELFRNKRETRRLDNGRPCPYRKGRVLWVREAWQYMCWFEGAPTICYRADLATMEICQREVPYGASWVQANETFDKGWRPGIHMFRAFSRIDLLATEEPRRERLEDITDEGAYREGFESRRDFLEYCREINKLPKGENPSVWVVMFELLRRKDLN